MSDSDSDSSVPTGPAEPQNQARLDFASILISTLGYGIYLVIAVAAIRLLLRRKTRSMGRDITLAYTIIMLVLVTVAFGTTAKTNTLLLIDSQYNPDVLNGLYCSRTNIATGVLTTLQVFMSDGLLMYRSYVILDGNWLVLALPCLTYLAIIGIGITANLLCASKDVGGTLNLPVTIDIGTPFYSLTVALNLLITLLIGFKLLRYRSRVVAAGMGGAPGLRELTGVVGILTESAALYAFVGIVYIATYVRDIPAQSPLQSLFSIMTFIAPSLIVLRVALGSAYTRSAGTYPSHSVSTGRTLRLDLAAGDEPRESTQHSAHGMGIPPHPSNSPPTFAFGGGGAYGGAYGDTERGGNGSPYEKPSENLSAHSVGAYEMGSMGRK